MENVILVDNFEKKKSSRDLMNFIRLRSAMPSDDVAIAELLTDTFLTTYKIKLPTIETSEERKKELRNVSMRRKNGYVSVAELGYQIIGTYSLIHPESHFSESWGINGATLRCVALHTNFHGLNLSQLLLNDAERVASLWNADAIYLHVQNGADKVAKLYETHGYLRDPSGDKTSFGCDLLGYKKNLISANQ